MNLGLLTLTLSELNALAMAALNTLPLIRAIVPADSVSSSSASLASESATEIPGTPENRITKVSNLCSLGNRPLIMTGLMRLLLTDHYRVADNIEHAQFRSRLWRDDVMTGIAIEDATVWQPEISDKRPAIIIRRNSWKSIKLGINNLSGTTPTGFDEHTKFWRGSHTLFCIAKEGAEAEILAAETYRYLLHFGPVFRKYFNLLMFELVEVGGLSELEEATERYAVPITVAYGWDETWVLQLLTPRLKHISLASLFPPTPYHTDET